MAFVVFASGALAQVALSQLALRQMLRIGRNLLIAGLGLLVAGMWLPSLALFVVGAVVTGAGGGLVFRGALAVAGSTAPPGARAEVLAGYFLGAYIGLSVPVVALGIATQYIAARYAMLVFVVLVSLALVVSVRLVVHVTEQGGRQRIAGSSG
jgi:MFS family permease